MSAISAHAIDIYDTDKTFRIGAGWQSLFASSYYDMDGELVSTREATHPETGETYEYTTDYSVYSPFFSAEALLTENLSVYTLIPFGFYNLTEKYMMQSDFSRTIRAEFDLRQFKYFMFGARHLLYDGESDIFSLLQVKLPSGGDESIINDPDYEFLSDGAFELLAGSQFRTRLGKIRLMTMILYNYRAEELTDRVLFSSSAGLSSVEDTELKVMIDIARSVESFKNAVAFDPRETPLQSNYIDLGFGFDIIFLENWLGEFSYKVRLSGKNAWNKGLFNIKISFLGE